MVAAASASISSRIQDVIDAWDRENGVVTQVRNNIIKKFQKDVELFEDQIKQIEGIVSSHRSSLYIKRQRLNIAPFHA